MKIPRRTLRKDLCFQGVSLHQGKHATLRLIPTDKGKIEIRRSDICQGFYTSKTTIIPGSHSTTIGEGDCYVRTVEHLFAALHAFCITDLIIEVDGPEIPALDGSALPFATAIDREGTIEVGGEITALSVKKETVVKDGRKYVVIEPHHAKLKLKYEIEFDHEIIGRQSFEIDVSPESFIKDLSPARTFGFEKDLEKLMKMGFAKGANLTNVIAIGKMVS